MTSPSDYILVDLPEVLDLSAATPLANRLLALRGKPLRLNAAHVRRLGGLCLQVLLAARLTWATDNVRMEIVGASSGFKNGWELSGAPPLAA